VFPENGNILFYFNIAYVSRADQEQILIKYGTKDDKIKIN